MENSNTNQASPRSVGDANKIILFANQKGGVGKTTLCGLFSNFLVAKGVPILVVDADLQQTLMGIREGDLDELKRKYPEADPQSFIHYYIKGVSLQDKETTHQTMATLRATDFTTIIDTPGSLSQDGFIEVLANADYIICPYLFDLNTIRSTRTFIHLVHSLKQQYPAIKAQMLFVCNRKSSTIGTNAEIKAWDALDKYFATFGIVVPYRIGDYKAVKDYNTIDNSDDASKRVNPCFEYIYKLIYGGTDDGKQV